MSGKSLERIAGQQLRHLSEQLRDRADTANGHHEARKCVKRLRALLVLARPAVGARLWSKLDRQLARAARDLSGARDHAVILQTLDQLQEEYGAAALGAAGRRLRAELSQQQDLAEARAGLPAVERRLAKIAKRWQELPLNGFAIGDALSGLEADYRSGRRQFRHAYAVGTAEVFHELRKHVQRHWRHMHLFAAPWPQQLEAHIDLARALSELLGEEHDLWLLRQRLGDDGQTLDQLCQQRQDRLRAESRGQLSLLFAERPKALRRRLSAYWAAPENSNA